MAKSFYKEHLDCIVHVMSPIKFSSDYFIQSIQTLDSYFNYTSPALWVAGWMIMPLFIFFGIRLWKYDRTKGIIFIFAGTFLIASLGISKITDQLDTIFFSSARMFLTIPLLCGILFYFFNNLKIFNERKTIFVFVSLALIFFSIKAFTYTSTIKKYTNKTDLGAVAIKKYIDLKKECDEINKMAQINNVDLIVFSPNWAFNTPNCEFYNYALPLLTNTRAKTVMSVFERRTWVFNEEANKMTYQEMYLWIQKTSHKFSIGERLTLIHLLSKPETTITAVEKSKVLVPIQKRTVVADEDIEIEDDNEEEEPPKSLLSVVKKKK